MYSEGRAYREQVTELTRQLPNQALMYPVMDPNRLSGPPEIKPSGEEVCSHEKRVVTDQYETCFHCGAYMSSKVI